MASGYKITAMIIKPGEVPITRTRFTRGKMTKSQCEKMFSLPDIPGRAARKRDIVLVEDFCCGPVDYFKQKAE
ncbi:hypothetical protein HmCmsJML254_03163 [Escherichia coli]|uniref:DUF1187 family protein n=1 Tax=Escherichia coli TaxID=562 RepID=UPI0010CC34AC|nr:DUF1187 family protein [Escherichia coli]EKT8796752.1 DUF1187 family protein [Escherichia coli]GDD11018.1 hypothetical protein HmCmsJML254_03163 [Escherichia coli]HAX4930227.1 DUF1187 family protein [Escherichia coli]